MRQSYNNDLQNSIENEKIWKFAQNIVTRIIQSNEDDLGRMSNAVGERLMALTFCRIRHIFKAMEK